MTLFGLVGFKLFALGFVLGALLIVMMALAWAAWASAKIFRGGFGWVVALALIFPLVTSGCASLGGARHVATVTVVSAHGVLATIQDTENALVCGRPTAPAPPQCVPLEKHREIAQLLARAFTLDAAIAKTLRDMPVGSPQPDQVLKELGEIGDLVKAIVGLIPQSAAKTSLVQNLGGK